MTYSPINFLTIIINARTNYVQNKLLKRELNERKKYVNKTKKEKQNSFFNDELHVKISPQNTEKPKTSRNVQRNRFETKINSQTLFFAVLY